MKKRRKSNREIRFNYDTQIDLHGYRVDEAILAVRREMSRGHRSIMVIHGHGTGALRDAVRSFARRNSAVSDYHFGEDLGIPGGDGVTIIYT